MVNGLHITDVRIAKLKEKSAGGLFAFANVTFNDSLVVRGIKILEGSKGVYLRFPQESKRKPDGTFDNWDLVFPIKSDLRSYINDEVFRHCDPN